MTPNRSVQSGEGVVCVDILVFAGLAKIVIQAVVALVSETLDSLVARITSGRMDYIRLGNISVLLATTTSVSIVRTSAKGTSDFGELVFSWNVDSADLVARLTEIVIWANRALVSNSFDLGIASIAASRMNDFRLRNWTSCICRATSTSSGFENLLKTVVRIVDSILDAFLAQIIVWANRALVSNSFDLSIASIANGPMNDF